METIKIGNTTFDIESLRGCTEAEFVNKFGKLLDVNPQEAWKQIQANMPQQNVKDKEIEPQVETTKNIFDVLGSDRKTKKNRRAFRRGGI